MVTSGRPEPAETSGAGAVAGSWSRVHSDERRRQHVVFGDAIEAGRGLPAASWMVVMVPHSWIAEIGSCR